VLWLPFVRQLGPAVVIFDQHDLSPELYLAKGGRTGSVLHRALLWLERAAYAVADLVIVPNGSYRRVAMGRGRLTADRVHVVRNAPDERVWTPVDPDPALRRDADTVLCYTGSIGTQDGVDQLLRGLARARTRTPHRRYQCIIAGDGDGLSPARHLAADLGVADSVAFRGWIADQDELRRVVAAADIAVEPCPSNGFNDSSTMVKLMNYLAVGRPIVAFDLPEHRETTGDAALLVEPDLGADGLGDAIASLAEDDAARTRLAAAARVRLARAGLTVGDARRALLAAYAHARTVGIEKGYPW
jgi:glycosyltransferase involved in cell wall biosynthesis